MEDMRVSEEDKQTITAYETAVRDLLRSLVSLYSQEVRRYEKLMKRAESHRDEVIRAAYTWLIEPKELVELSGIGKSKLHSDILNTNAYPHLRRMRQAEVGDRAATARFNNIRRTVEGLVEGEEDRDSDATGTYSR